MGERDLKEIFELMHEKLTNLAVGDGFSRWINEAREFTFDDAKKQGDNFLFEQLTLVTFYGGFKAKTVDEKWPNIKKAFDDFDICKIAGYDEDRVNQIVHHTPGIISHEGKIRATAHNAKKVVEIQRKYGSFADYIESFEDQSIQANELIKKFRFLGRETVWDYLKSIGFDAIKPDVHVRRILFRLGLISGSESSSKIIKEVFKIADRMSKSTGERLGVIDATIWFYGADRPKEIKKPICGTEPLCDDCYLTMFCKHYQNMQSNRNLSDFTEK